MRKYFMSAIVVLALAVGYCHAAVPGRINYQGKLTDSAGKLVADGSYSMTFKLFDAITGGAEKWSETHTGAVVVTNGLFNVVLGATSDLTSVFQTNDLLWLQITIGAEILDPRQEMASVGYAIRANYATDMVDLNSVQTITGVKTLSAPVINVGSDAQGDTYYRNASGSFTRLPPGTSGQFLKTQGAGADPLWATPSGTIVQVVNAAYGTKVDNTTESYADTGLTATITPTSASNKILVIVSQNGLRKGSSGNFGISIRLLRGASAVFDLGNPIGYGISSVTEAYLGGVSVSYLDSPATTSATTYKTQLKAYGTPCTVSVQAPNGQATSTITLMEIAN